MLFMLFMVKSPSPLSFSEKANMKPEIQSYLDSIRESLDRIGRPVQIMEVCGTHTVALFRTGVKSMLPAGVTLISGPGCPVCVTSQGYLDAACELARLDNVTICTYGDMVRVPGSKASLQQMRARGATIHVIYSTRDVLAYAKEHPEKTAVFLAVGFETTTPATAAMLLEAKATGVTNVLILPGHKLVMPAMDVLLSAGDAKIDGFLCPGHVSIILGANAYQPIVEQYHKPCVIAGFEPAGMLDAIARICQQLADDDARVDNAYSLAVRPEGNGPAMAMIDRVFTPADDTWRAIGTLPLSGLSLREEFAEFDAYRHFQIQPGPDVCPPGCRCGDVIQGKASPAECPLFAKACTPIEPVGPCMVSSEGACAAWFKYSPR